MEGLTHHLLSGSCSVQVTQQARWSCLCSPSERHPHIVLLENISKPINLCWAAQLPRSMQRWQDVLSATVFSKLLPPKPFLHNVKFLSWRCQTSCPGIAEELGMKWVVTCLLWLAHRENLHKGHLDLKTKTQNAPFSLKSGSGRGQNRKSCFQQQWNTRCSLQNQSSHSYLSLPHVHLKGRD